MSGFGGYIRQNLIKILTLVAIVAVLVALILPATKWAASGNIRFPVRVFVFDAAHGSPIANAHVGIFWAPSRPDVKSLADGRDSYDPENRIREGESGTTDSGGTVVINYNFTTGANHERPTMYAHLRVAWVHVHAEGYGGVVVPVRHDSLPTAILRKQKELLVPIGMTRER